MEDNKQNNCVAFNKYIIIQRQKCRKLHLLSEKCNTVLLGKDEIKLDVIAGNPFGTIFKLIPVKGSSNKFTLQVCDSKERVSFCSLMKDFSSGADNRNLCDDGRAQTLSGTSIAELREQGIAASEIMNQLLKNSKTFQSKTEYAQEKYLKKKERKHCEYVTIENPNLRVLCELFYNMDLPKSVGLRVDVLSQVITGINLQPGGSYLLFDNGYHGLVTAACLSYLKEGKLVRVTPGNLSKGLALLAMNFDEEKMSQLIMVTLSNLLNQLDESNEENSLVSDKYETNCTEAANSTTMSSSTSSMQISVDDQMPMESAAVSEKVVSVPSDKLLSQENTTKVELLSGLNSKRKQSLDNNTIQSDNFKKPRWTEYVERAVDILKSKKVDGLIIVCREYPNNILLKFLPYVGLSRPFVVHSLYQEPLIQLYGQLKKMQNTILLRITDCWFRGYQVLPARTHPSVIMSPSSGYLLSGIVVSSE